MSSTWGLAAPMFFFCCSIEAYSAYNQSASFVTWNVVMEFISLLRLKLVQLLKHLKDGDILGW